MNTIWKYERYLPPVPEADRISLGEGQTPLVRSRSIGKALGIENLFFKLENLNPTGSYKDRFAAVLVSEMIAKRQKVCIATSSGNTGAALAAYCAAAGITCIIVVVDGAPLPKVKQMQLYGAHIWMVKGFGKDPEVTARIFDQLETWSMALEIPLPISAYRYCPSAMQGVQTISYEIAEELGHANCHIFSPAGGGGLTLAITKGLLHGEAPYAAKVSCVQPKGNDTIASAIGRPDAQATAIQYSTTTVSGLQVANVLDGDEVIGNVRLLEGNGYVVADEEVFAWQKQLARQEGIFCEPAGAVALAGLKSALDKKQSDHHDHVVCLITGSGFKDMFSVENTFSLPAVAPLDEATAIESISKFL
nr:pyridoxal-phosphate dependent enzyme [uncultured Dyadobacter sp.]